MAVLLPRRESPATTLNSPPKLGWINQFTYPGDEDFDSTRRRESSQSTPSDHHARPTQPLGSFTSLNLPYAPEPTSIRSAEGNHTGRQTNLSSNATPIASSVPLMNVVDSLASTQASLSNPAAAAAAREPTNQAQVCSEIRVRKEWRTMDRESQKSFIAAIKCMLSKPPRLQDSGSQRLYDDFVYVHDRSRNHVHWVSAFLPCKTNYPTLVLELA